VKLAALSGRATLAAVVATGLVAMALLQTMHSDTNADLVELLNKEPAKLGPIVNQNGAEVPLESFRGKVLILNLWAPWCVPCLQEMPSLDRLAKRLPENDFVVVAVAKDALGDTPSRRMFDKMGLSRLNYYLDPKGRLESEISARGFPTTLILGADGAPLAIREGAASWDSDEMVTRLDRLAGRSRQPK
jgi:thiol-disulfide isomerase/thioredoxin